MAHTLTIQGWTQLGGYNLPKINGVEKTDSDSPITLKSGDIIKVPTDRASVTINGTSYVSQATTLNLVDQDIALVASGPERTLEVYNYVIINYSERKSVDLTTLPGWANLSAGNHTIKIKAKGTGYKDSELSAGVTVSKAASTVTLEAGTYKFVDSPTAPQKDFLNVPLVFRSYNAQIEGLSQYTLISVYFDEGSTSVFTIEYEGDEIEPQTAFYDGSWGTADDNFKTMIIATDQQVSQEFYNWAITQGNLVKQTGYNLTINYSTVPMSTSAAYIKINSDTVSSSNYDYVVQPGTSSTNPTLKNSAGTTLTVPYVVPNVEKVAFMGGLAIAVGGGTNNTSPYTLTADTIISPGVYGPTADTPIDEPTI